MIDLYDFFPRRFHSYLENIPTKFEKNTIWAITIIFKNNEFENIYLAVSTKGDFIFLIVDELELQESMCFSKEENFVDEEDDDDYDYIVKWNFCKRRYNLDVDLSFENCRDLIL